MSRDYPLLRLLWCKYLHWKPSLAILPQGTKDTKTDGTTTKAEKANDTTTAKAEKESEGATTDATITQAKKAKSWTWY